MLFIGAMNQTAVKKLYLFEGNLKVNNRPTISMYIRMSDIFNKLFFVLFAHVLIYVPCGKWMNYIHTFISYTRLGTANTKFRFIIFE